MCTYVRSPYVLKSKDGDRVDFRTSHGASYFNYSAILTSHLATVWNNGKQNLKLLKYLVEKVIFFIFQTVNQIFLI